MLLGVSDSDEYMKINQSNLVSKGKFAFSKFYKKKYPTSSCVATGVVAMLF